MKSWILEEASIEITYVSLGFLNILDGKISKTNGFLMFLNFLLFLAKTLEIIFLLF